MYLVKSLAVVDTTDVLGVALSSSNTSTAIKLEDHSLHLFDLNAELIRSRPPPTKRSNRLDREAFKFVDGAFIVADTISQRLIVEDIKGHVISSATLPFPAATVIVYEGVCKYLIAVANLSEVALVPITSNVECLQNEIATKKLSMLSYRAFKHHISHGLLALLCSDGIIQIWRLPTSDDDLQSICTITALASLPPLRDDTERRKLDEETKGAQIFSVLVQSPTCILTGHRDGKIRVWHINAASELSTSVIMNKPVQVVQASEKDLINNILATDGLPFANVVSTDTQGFVRLWRISDTKHDPLQLIGCHQLFDHAIICPSISPDGQWLVTGGKNGGSEEDACGLDGRVRAIRLSSLAKGERVEVKEIGEPSLAVWNLNAVRTSSGESRIVISCMKRGRAWLEIWDITDM